MNLPDSWIETTVGKVVIDLQPGFAQKPGEDDEGMTAQIRTHNISPEGRITLAGIKHVSPSIKELERYKLTVGDVVFNNTNSVEWVGKTAVFDQEGEYVFSNHMTRLRVDNLLINPDFLARYLQFLWSMGYSKTRAKRWVSQAGIEGATLASFKLPLPTLFEQQRIVDMFGEAQRLRELRHSADITLSRIKQALFLEMFGDPASNRKRLRKKAIGKLIKFKSGDFLSAKKMAADGIFKVYGGNGVNGLHDQYMFEERKIVLGRVGAYCGVVHYSEPKSWITDNALYVSEKLEYLDDHYLVTALELANLNRYAGQAGQPLISASRINPVEILVPDEAEQKKFSTFVLSLLELGGHRDKAEKQLDEILKELSQQAFIGQLTEMWRNQHHAELEAAVYERDAVLRERGTIISVRTNTMAPPEHTTDFLLSMRHWLLNELSEFQGAVWTMLRQEWRNLVIVDDPESFNDFCTNEQTTRPIEHFNASPNRIRRTLEQLAGLGLIAKVSVPRQNAATQQTDYLTAFRPLRDNENTRLRDAAMLKSALNGNGPSSVHSEE
ncbi:restriction endonuclease subunit S [Methylicorpusculum sp.]|uniref:restriction endonuclease subunit S n=1 Tax=Methylicorpusculum sp. TaxID=2713644 RepID=UPI00273063DA|nr:restriction endonuclease subunit S [Methylicorpusculum sp.]MDP2177200.1 restriction endonuclease subunit S [Methylicorpusculum sp.]MDP3531125.1 restriction endonuclease subunit S [Methylicorpusculum sp.]